MRRFTNNVDQEADGVCRLLLPANGCEEKITIGVN